MKYITPARQGAGVLRHTPPIGHIVGVRRGQASAESLAQHKRRAGDDGGFVGFVEGFEVALVQVLRASDRLCAHSGDGVRE